MSAQTSGDVSLIHDEDLLRKMWQDTEDFGRKKEIRAHMYKLREQRLRNFYNSGEVSSDIQRTTTTSTESKTCTGSTHADSLADHSFISMKTKEIRDSSSPTKDDIYRISDKALSNQGWNVVTSNKTSDDGKTYTTSKVATTSGTEKIDGGQVDYAAKTEQQASVFKDGDDKNYTKAVGASASSVIKQEAQGGDQNSSFRSSSTKTSSSSKYVAEQRSTSGDIKETQILPERMIANQSDEYLVSRKVYSENIPNDLKQHPSYVEGKTKVTRETRTLPDGTTVTTTKYEIRGGNAVQSKSSQSTTEHRSASSVVRSSQSQASNQNEVKSSRCITQEPSSTTVIRELYDSKKELQPATTSTIKAKSHTDHADFTNVSKSVQSQSQSHFGSSTAKTTVVRQVGDYRDDNTTSVIQSQPSITQDSSTTVIKKVYEPTTVDSNVIRTTVVKNINEPSTNIIKSTTVKNYVDVDNRQKVTSDSQSCKTTATKEIYDSRKMDEVDRRQINEQFISVEKQESQVPQRKSPEKQMVPTEKQKSPERRPKSEEKYSQPERRQPIKPGKSEWDDKSTPTEGQYDTTYRSDFTNKKISVEVSPTHDAFARSLRAVSPDRISKASSPTRSLRTSTNSLRGSTSPEKMRHPSRVSPERRSTSPKKTFSSETITKSRATDGRTTRTVSEIDGSTLTRRSKTRTRSRSPSPTSTVSDFEFIKNANIVTDLDTNVTTYTRPSSLDVKKTRKVTDRSPTSPLTETTVKRTSSKDVIRTNSLRHISPTKEGPKADRPLKRTDTYEERCRQILGLTNDTKRKTSLERNEVRRGSATKTTPEKTSPVKDRYSPIRKSPEKKIYDYSLKQKSPVKEGPKIGEFPSQIRRSPEKATSRPYPDKKSPVKDRCTVSEFPSQIRRSPEKTPSEPYPKKSSPSKEGPKISEFPSQIRKSPEKPVLEAYPERKSPVKESPKIGEFPSQTRKSPEKTPLEPYPEKKRSTKDTCQLNEFPSQIRKSPEQEPLVPYPEKVSPTKEGPKISEFPSQIRRSPEKEVLGPYPEKVKPEKDHPTISEFPSQIRKSPEKDIQICEPSFDVDSKNVSEVDRPLQKLLYPEKVIQEKVQTHPKKTVTSEETLIKKIEAQLELNQTEPTTKKSKPKTRKDSSSSTTTDEEVVEEIQSVVSQPTLEGRVPVDEPIVTKKFISQLVKDDEVQRTDLTKKETQKTLIEKMVDTANKTKNKTVKKDSPRTTTELFIEKEKLNTVKHTNGVTSPTKKPTERSSSKTLLTTKVESKTSKVKDEKTKTKSTEKTTLYDIENMNKSREDNKIHIRTQRVDDSIKATKTKPVEKKATVTKSVTLSEKRSTTEQKLPKRHVVTTTITVTPTTKTGPVTKTATPKTPVKTPKATKVTSKKPQIQNGHATSDDESVTEHSEERVIKKEKFVASTNQVNKKKATSVRNVTQTNAATSKPKQPKCVTTKSIVVNNETSEKEVIVDLQRSKSSREQTPDQICPLPVSSDDDSAPRYPDKISEPDDSTFKRKPKKLSEMPIIENQDSEFTRITEVREDSNIERTDISLASIDKKIHKFSDTTQKIKTKQGPAPKVERPKLEVTEDLEADECLLSVSEKVNKFITTAEQLTTPSDLQRPKSPKCQYYPEEDVKISEKVAHFITTAEEVVQKKPAPKKERPSFDEVDENIREDVCLMSVSDKVNKFKSTTDTSVSKDTKIALSKIDIKPSKQDLKKEPIKETTPPRRPSNQYSSVKTDSETVKYPRRDSSPKFQDSTPRSTRRPSQEEPKSVLSPTVRLRSTESVKKAKALFENINQDQKVLKQRDILSRPSVFGGRKMKSDASRKLEYESRETNQRSRSPDKDTSSRRSLSPEGDIPGYMKPLDRSLRPNSPHRENIDQINKKYYVVKNEESSDVRQTKFGVTLKRTDSGRHVISSTSSSKTRVIEDITDEEIEKIFDLELLEELLEKVVSYEIRRKIRVQIRLVKQLISEGKLEQVLSKSVRSQSPVKERSSIERSEYKSYAYSERKSSSEFTKVTRSQSPETKVIKSAPRSSPETCSKVRRSKSPEMKVTAAMKKVITTETKTTREKSPEKVSTKKVFQAQLKKTAPASKSAKEQDKETPEWVKQRNLRKVTDSTVTTKTSTATAVKKTRSSPMKETKFTDSITSSYGVGPTDENGSPLFGLKALRAQKKTDTTKVQGTVIKSQYYSENGNEPVGEISVTKYSTDPRDLGRDEDLKTGGITSITTTQKFGYKDTPSLKSLTKKNKEICEKSETVETKSSKLNRRGSVKALSQKFIENAVETSKSERQSSYPKAGLILRTSSFKDSASSGESREGSAERTTVKSSRTVSGETFLTSHTKVTGVQDVITRMKAEDVREGDSAEDVEARGLLNKFLGAQVILSGIESSVKSSTTNAKRSTKVTTTVTEEGKPVTRTRVFHHPLTDDLLQTIWDEQTLRLLLEQSADYEERRLIRARLRQVMAEQEACTQLVEKASQDQIGSTFEGESQLLPLLQGLLEAPDNEQTADSGTESGEDQRTGLIAEVQLALDKLSANLRDDATDITTERRTSLLQLVTKLQAGLAASAPPPQRRSSGQGRFRRRQRPNRHTVGVSSEELADARRLIEEISLHDLTPSSRTKSLLQKQNSEGCVGQNIAITFKPTKSVVKNAIAKPFSSSNSTVSGNSSSVQTPTECLDFLFNEEPEKKPDFAHISLDEQNVSRSSSGDVSIKSVQHALKQAAARKSTENLLEAEETDEETMKPIKTEEKKEVKTYDLPQPDLIMHNNPVYQKFNEEKLNKFNSKKLKMKRANTIDIPKPLNFYEDDDDSDCSLPEEDYQQRRRNTYLALRGPIRVGQPENKNQVPAFEPKTENDKKFLAFINKQNESNTTKKELSKSSLWTKPETNRGSIWNNKFGNIKTAFEKASTGPVNSQNSARQFWKSADDAITSGSKYDGPKISKQNARNLREMFEEKQKQQSQKVPWSGQNEHIVTGSLKVKAFEPINDKSHKFVPQPLPMNKFSHAPQSAFKPIPKKAPPSNLQLSKTPVRSDEKGKDLDSPLYLYSPKPPSESPLKPWIANPSESRVLSLAASKFENVAQPEVVPIKPRKLSKDKVTMPFQQQQPPEKLTAPYLVKSAEQSSNTVKQISGQYNKGNDGYSSSHSTAKYPQVEHKRVQNYEHYQPSNHNQSKGQYQGYPQMPAQHSQDHYYQQSPNRQSANYQQQYHPNMEPQQFVYPPQIPDNRHHQYGSHVLMNNVSSPNYYPTQRQPQDSYTSSSRVAYVNDYHPNQQHSEPQYTSTYQYQPHVQTSPQKRDNQESKGQHQYQAQVQSPPTNYSQEREQEPRDQYQAQVRSPPVNYSQKHDQEPKGQYQAHIQSPPVNYSHKRDKQLPREPYQYQDHIQSPPIHYSQKHDNQQSKGHYQYHDQIQSPPINYSQKRDNQHQTHIQSPSESYPQKRDNQDLKEQYQTPENYQKRDAQEQYPPKLDSQVSVESLKEYNAVNSRVMTGPVSQQATTVRQKSPMNRNEHDMAAALNLRNTLQRVSQSPQKSVSPEEKAKTKEPENYSLRNQSSSPSTKVEHSPRNDPPKIMSPPTYNQRNVSPHTFSYKPRQESPKAVSPHSFSYKNNYRNEKRSATTESLEINDHGESIVTSRFQIPVINVPQPESPRPPSQAQIANKADTWNQICLQNQQPLHKPSPRASPNARTVIKSKSSHSLAVPKQFEAGMTKDEMVHKRKTVEAYLSGSKSPQTLSRSSSNENLKAESKSVKRTINRLKTSEKMSISKSSGLSRSRTLPDIVCPDMLDESNVDKAFEELFKSSS